VAYVVYSALESIPRPAGRADSNVGGKPPVAETTSKGLARRAWERWKAVAKKIGNFQGRVILTIFYILVVPFFAVVVKVFKDPLHLRASSGKSYWRERTSSSPDESSARRQF
jgi:hypothetical protein